ncbi:MAG: hypothetical protein IJJ09_03270, partial [Synergistaceae bacterium]|nr:hypothetical protein [Synergistaceae bacterium]
MENFLMLRYIFEFLMIIPAVIFAVLPVLNDLRFKSLKFHVTTGILLLCLVILGAYIRAEFKLSSAFIIIPYSILLFILYIILVNLSTGRKLFCFFNSVMLCTFCPLYTIFIAAPFEAGNKLWQTTGLMTLKSNLICIGLVLIIGAIFFRTLYIKLPMLMKQEYIGTVWDFLFLVPMFMTFLMWWS